MIKQNAKRNARQHKKLKSGPWTQWTWRYKLEGDFPSDESLDELYDMADKCKIWLMITERDGYISLIARNEGELGVGIAFSKDMAERMDRQPKGVM